MQAQPPQPLAGSGKAALPQLGLKGNRKKSKCRKAVAPLGLSPGLPPPGASALQMAASALPARLTPAGGNSVAGGSPECMPEHLASVDSETWRIAEALASAMMSTSPTTFAAQLASPSSYTSQLATKFSAAIAAYSPTLMSGQQPWPPSSAAADALGRSAPSPMAAAPIALALMGSVPSSSSAAMTTLGTGNQATTSSPATAEIPPPITTSVLTHASLPAPLFPSAAAKAKLGGTNPRPKLRAKRRASQEPFYEQDPANNGGGAHSSGATSASPSSSSSSLPSTPLVFGANPPPRPSPTSSSAAATFSDPGSYIRPAGQLNVPGPSRPAAPAHAQLHSPALPAGAAASGSPAAGPLAGGPPPSYSELQAANTALQQHRDWADKRIGELLRQVCRRVVVVVRYRSW